MLLFLCGVIDIAGIVNFLLLLNVDISATCSVGKDIQKINPKYYF